MLLSHCLRWIPLPTYYPLRLGVAQLPRAHPVRKGCVAALKVAQKANERALPHRLAEIRPLDARHISFVASDSMVMEAAYWFGLQGYEGVVPRVWSTLCQRARSVLEVGGNVGLYSVIGGLATRGRTYTVLEPVPEVAQVLRANLQRNGLDHVQLRQAAAVPLPSAATVRLNIPIESHHAPVGSHLVDDVEVHGRSSSRVIEVAGLPFRELVQGRDLVKLDAEGIEAELLSSAWEALLDCKPSLLIEVLPQSKRLAQLVRDLAEAGGYKLAALPEYGTDQIHWLEPQHFDADVPVQHHAKDVLLTPSRIDF